MSHRRPRPLHALVPALLALALLAGCTVSRPEGPSPLRYRDAVFTAVDRTNDIQYGSAPDRAGNPEALKLDLYQPSGDTIAKRPVLIWIHGGGFIQGDKASGSTIATYFAKLGYVTASINYRLLAPGGCAGERELPPGCEEAALGAQHDAQAAVRWFRAHAAQYRIDPERIASGGGSAGAITSILAGTHSEDPGDSGNPGFSSRIAAARVGVRRPPDQRDHHLRRRSHDLLPRDRGQRGVLRLGDSERQGPRWTTACRRSSSPSRVRVTA